MVLEIMEAAKIVLDKLAPDAEYLHADIGWEFWKTEAGSLPKGTTAAVINEGEGPYLLRYRRQQLSALGC